MVSGCWWEPREMQHVLIPHLDEVNSPFPPKKLLLNKPARGCWIQDSLLAFQSTCWGILPARFTAGLGGEAQHQCKSSCHTHPTQHSALPLFGQTTLNEQLSSKWWLLGVCLNHSWALQLDNSIQTQRKKNVRQSLALTSSCRTQLKHCHITPHKKKKGRKNSPATLCWRHTNSTFSQYVFSLVPLESKIK